MVTDKVAKVLAIGMERFKKKPDGGTWLTCEAISKTGTTNDSIDAWFAGYQAKLVGIAWMGFDQPRNLGNRETGGGLSLPIWMGFMQTALKNIPMEERAVPNGIIQAEGDYYYVENPPGSGIQVLDANEPIDPTIPIGSETPAPAPANTN